MFPPSTPITCGKPLSGYAKKATLMISKSVSFCLPRKCTCTTGCCLDITTSSIAPNFAKKTRRQTDLLVVRVGRIELPSRVWKTRILTAVLYPQISKEYYNVLFSVIIVLSPKAPVAQWIEQKTSKLMAVGSADEERSKIQACLDFSEYHREEADFMRPISYPEGRKRTFIVKSRYAPVAQWIEQKTSKLMAVGSIPTRGTK